MPTSVLPVAPLERIAARYYETLSAQDESFLAIEGPALHMHIGATMVFGSGPLSRGAGAVDITDIRGHIAKRLHLIPRYRQRLARGLAGEALWVDDERFELDFHLRHVRLPAPGDDDTLKALAARLMSQPLDRTHPLWEIWIVEGLAGDRFALINKIHHCMVDGLSGVEVIGALLSLTTEGTDDSVRALSWAPRRPPSAFTLLRDQAAKPFAACQAVARRLAATARDPRETWDRALHSVSAAGQAITAGLRLTAATRFNHPIGSERRLEWLSLDLDEVKAVKNSLGGTLNDTVLAIVAGALHRFLGSERAMERLPDLRVLVPVSMRSEHERSALGNRISAWVVDMPVAEHDPRRRLSQLCAQTARLRTGDLARGLEMMWVLGPRAITLAMHLMNWLSPFNLVVTNVPGPQLPLYLLGAPLTAVYPHVPLFTNQGLGVALFSYADRLYWGFNADRDLLPDLAELARCVSAAFDELRELAREAR